MRLLLIISFLFIILKLVKCTKKPDDRYNEIKLEHLIIYNQQKYPMTIDELNKNKLALDALQYAIDQYNNNNKIHHDKDLNYYKLNKILNAYKQPYDEQIYTINVNLIKTNCKKPLIKATKNSKTTTTTTKAIALNMAKCAPLKPNKTLNCLIKILVIPWETSDKRFKVYEIKC
jgi:hypothetical protein